MKQDEKVMKKPEFFREKEAMQAFFRSDTSQPGMGTLSATFVAIALNPTFFDPAACKKLILGAVCNNRALCPHCGEPLTAENNEKFWNGKQVYCGICKKKSHATTGTQLSGTTLTPSQLVCMSIPVFARFR
jgi:hypothetical protein